MQLVYLEQRVHTNVKQVDALPRGLRETEQNSDEAQ